MKRSRSNDGARTHTEMRVPVRASLIYSVLGTPDPIERKAPGIFHGPKAARGCPPSRLSDAQVLRIRALDKFEWMPAKEIAQLTGVDLAGVKNALSYLTRTHLEPKPEHAEA